MAPKRPFTRTRNRRLRRRLPSRPPARPKARKTAPECRLGPARAGFSGLEWNALIKRARSRLQALRECQANPDAPCLACPMAGMDADRRPERRETPCRSDFRALEQRLAHLANRAPKSERQQLRRTVDSLHLAYRQLALQEERHAQDI